MEKLYWKPKKRIDYQSKFVIPVFAGMITQKTFYIVSSTLKMSPLNSMMNNEIYCDKMKEA